MRLLVWLVLVALVYLAVRSKVRSLQENSRNAARAEFEAQAATQKKATTTPENMVACEYCHIYLPASEAVSLVTPSSSHFFCSEDHMRSHNSGRLSTTTSPATPNE
jgi:hypothetical protein